jgi:hypothetical protein
LSNHLLNPTRSTDERFTFFRWAGLINLAAIFGEALKDIFEMRSK